MEECNTALTISIQASNFNYVPNLHERVRAECLRIACNVRESIVVIDRPPVARPRRRAPRGACLHLSIRWRRRDADVCGARPPRAHHRRTPAAPLRGRGARAAALSAVDG